MAVRTELYKHFMAIVEPIEKLRGVSDILADQHNVDKNELWQWAVGQITD